MSERHKLSEYWRTITDLMTDFAREQNRELVERLEKAEQKLVVTTVALESISGTISADYAIRRANQALAEIGVEGY